MNRAPSTPKSGRGRSKSAQKQAQILNAATELFTAQGYECVNMAEIALNAGVSKQTIYSHFGSKDELFAAALKQQTQHYQLTDELFDSNEPPEQFLPELAARFTDLILGDQAISLIRTCIESAKRHPKLAEIFWEQGPQLISDQLANYLSRQHEQGRLSIPDPQIASRQLLYMLKSESHFLRLLSLPSDPTPEELTRYSNSCIELFLKGYAR